MDVKFLGYGGDDVGIMSVVSSCGSFSVSSLGYFLSVGYSYKPSHYYLPLSIGEHHIQEYLNKNRGGGGKIR